MDNIERFQKSSLITLFLEKLINDQRLKVEQAKIKSDRLTTKIENRTAKIVKLGDKVDGFKRWNKTFELASKTLPLLKPTFNLAIANNQIRINKIEKKSIPRCEKKVQKFQQKLVKRERKIDTQTKKFDRLKTVKLFFKNFSNFDKQQRRSGFLQGLEALNNDTIERRTTKIEKYQAKYEKLQNSLDNAEAKDIQKVAGKIKMFVTKNEHKNELIKTKVAKLKAVNEKISELKGNNLDIDNIINKAEQQTQTAILNVMEEIKPNIASTVDKIIDVSNDVILTDLDFGHDTKTKVTQMETLDIQSKTERVANIENNTVSKVLENSLAEKIINQMQENSIKPEVFRNENQTVLKFPANQLKVYMSAMQYALKEAVINEIDTPKRSVINNNDLGIIGNEEMKSLGESKDLRFVTNIPIDKAMSIAKQLDNDNIKYSGRVYGDKVTITINNADTMAFKKATAMVTKVVQEIKTEKIQDNIIGNTDYKNIPNKAYKVFDTPTALKIAEQLKQDGVEFSGRIQGDKTTITVDRNNAIQFSKSVTKATKISMEDIQKKQKEIDNQPKQPKTKQKQQEVSL